MIGEDKGVQWDWDTITDRIQAGIFLLMFSKSLSEIPYFLSDEDREALTYLSAQASQLLKDTE